MDDCPLDLPGIQLDARGDRAVITVSIVVRTRSSWMSYIVVPAASSRPRCSARWPAELCANLPR